LSARISAWRARLPLLAVLLAIVAVNAAVLISYRSLVSARLGALTRERDTLATQVEATHESARKASEAAVQLEELESRLGVFYGETLGPRKERLAPLIEEIHAITKKAGFRVESWSYSEQELDGAEAISIRFGVSGRYEDIKRLLGVLESSQRFLVLEGVGVGIEEAEPDLLHVNLTVNHYFLGRQRRGIRPPKAGAKRPASSAARSSEPGVD